MKPLQLYAETSVWNFYFADDAPEKRDATIAFFDGLPASPYEVFISLVVSEEIAKAEPTKRQRLLELLERFEPEVLEVTEEVVELANQYRMHGAIPESKIEDSVHIACATVYELDAVISWNMKHIANLRRQERIQAVNVLNGYHKPLSLITPLEVSVYE
jgi:predicted nucleic acid-binding protein